MPPEKLGETMPDLGGGGPDHMRCSQADRDRCADVVKAAWVEGRLRDDEYHERVEHVLKATTYGQLKALVGDLPTGPMPVGGMVQQPLPVPPLASYPAPRHGWVQPMPYPVRPVPPAANGFAIASLVVGIVSMVAMWPATVLLTHGDFNPYPFVFAGVTVTTGHIGLHQARTREYPHNGGSGQATAGLVLGWIQMVLALLAAVNQ